MTLRKMLHYIFGTVAAIGMVASIAFAKCRFGYPFDRNDPVKVQQAVVLCFWILAPPIWFWFEYYFLYLPQKTRTATLDEYKHGVDQSAKIWLALITVLLGLYFGKDLVKDSSPASPQTPPTSSSPQSPR